MMTISLITPCLSNCNSLQATYNGDRRWPLDRVCSPWPEDHGFDFRFLGRSSKSLSLVHVKVVEVQMSFYWCGAAFLKLVSGQVKFPPNGCVLVQNTRFFPK
ncbi:hypothetical protein AVEN_152254-1 [Araneus ventricosus]|uniref:Uncharacterized protein n=1 Tax=Araneus ventricosus TaxID=182803 RepID=A0A4Y2S8Y9_ARAVE|nr:hypothetical protein AVEN_152254-1 [Araneus ventricosus]